MSQCKYFMTLHFVICRISIFRSHVNLNFVTIIYIFSTLFIHFTILAKTLTKCKNSYKNGNDAKIRFPSKKLRFRTFIYFYHDLMCLTEDDTSFPRVCKSRDSRISHANNTHDWDPLAWQLAEIGCDCSNIRILQEKLAH